MPLVKGKSKQAFEENVSRLISEGYPPDQAVAIARRIQRRSDAKPRMPKAQFPARIESRYQRELHARTKALHEATMKALAALLEEEDKRQKEEEERAQRGDSPAFRLDAVPKLKRILDHLRSAFSKISPLRVVSEIFGLGDSFVTAQAHHQVADVLKIPAYATKKAARLASVWTKENVALITSIDERYFNDVEKLVEESFAKGRTVSSLREDLEERYSVSRSRADLIARDQIGKLNSKVREHRHKQLGIVAYTWSDSDDERVRKRHAELDGKVFRYDDPPVINEDGERGHPGDDFQCRCTAEPVIEDEGEDPEEDDE